MDEQQKAEKLAKKKAAAKKKNAQKKRIHWTQRKWNTLRAKYRSERQTQSARTPLPDSDKRTRSKQDSKQALYGGLDKKDQKGLETVLTVCDYWTVAQVKKLYNDDLIKIQELLNDGDRLWFAQDVLEEKKELYKFGIKRDSVLLVEREDVTQVALRYICYDCGEEVRLKKNDFVRCRNCGYRIVYKKRTTNPCQYLARWRRSQFSVKLENFKISSP